jgi:hypothetical protein
VEHGCYITINWEELGSLAVTFSIDTLFFCLRELGSNDKYNFSRGDVLIYFPKEQRSLHTIHAQGLGHTHVGQPTFTLHIGQRYFRLQPMVKHVQKRAVRGVQPSTRLWCRV